MTTYIFSVAVVACLTVLVVAILKQRRAYNAVWDNLDNAAQNGYFEPGEHCYGMSPAELATDLTCYCDDERLHGISPQQLAYYVRQWCIARGLL